MKTCDFWEPPSLPIDERLSEGKATQNKAERKTAQMGHLNPGKKPEQPLTFPVLFRHMRRHFIFLTSN